MGLINTGNAAVLLVLLLFLGRASYCDAFVIVVAPFCSKKKPALMLTTTRIRATSNSNDAWWAGSGSTSSSSLYREQTGVIPGVDPCQHGASSCWVEEPTFIAEDSRSQRELELESQVEQLQADLERSQREQEAENQKALEKLIDVSDNLGRALEAVPETEREQNASLQTLCQGIAMTEKKLLAVLENGGLVRYTKIGDPFDHHVHHALFEYADPTKEPGTVGQILKAGYWLERDNRVLRYAEVAIVKEEEKED